MARTTRNLILKADRMRFSGEEIHLRQGDMDGACGPYCVVMALIALGFVDREDVAGLDYHGNTKVAKLMSHLENSNGQHLFKGGTVPKHFKEAINVSFGKEVEVDYLNFDAVPGSSFRDLTHKFVNFDDVRPVILGIDYGKVTPGRHWILVVGYEENVDGSTRFLILDPSADKPRNKQCWNATLDIIGSGSPLPYIMTTNHEERRVALVSAAIFSSK